MMLLRLRIEVRTTGQLITILLAAVLGDPLAVRAS